VHPHAAGGHPATRSGRADHARRCAGAGRHRQDDQAAPQSVTQFEAGHRADLVAKESADIAWLTQYLPAQLGDAELEALIREAIAATGAASMKEMGKVMGWLKPKVQGRTDIGALSARIKTTLGG